MITTQEVEKLAALARIKLSDADKASLTDEFGSILAYVDQLKKADVSLDAEGRVGAVRNVMRADESAPISSGDREALLAEAPDREGDHIAVKKIIAQ